MLIAQKQVTELSSPKPRVWSVYSNWFRSKKPFIGVCGEMVENRNEGDFVAVGAVGEHDFLTHLVERVTSTFVAFRQRSLTESAPAYYASQTVTRIITSVSIIGATLLLEAAIVTLYLVTNDRIRFVLIAIFISLFGAAISLLSNARRAEMFAATAAYAAVLVVFVSGDLGSGGPKT